MTVPSSDELLFLPLGGAGEIGMNLNLYGHAGKWLMVDLGIGFPYTSVEQKKATYDFFRANLKDQESLREMEFPAQYMFKGVPDIVPEGTDVVQWVVDKMDEFGIAIAMTSVSPNGIEARRRHPDRFVLQQVVSPHAGVEALRTLERSKA